MLIYFFIFILGLAVGSFLNCVIYRLEQEKSFLRGRSFCPDCSHQLQWLDLIPVLSFF
ncbi:MAG: prepilin peptidase, partial [Pseudomonadota bacterium]